LTFLGTFQNEVLLVLWFLDLSKVVEGIRTYLTKMNYVVVSNFIIRKSILKKISLK